MEIIQKDSLLTRTLRLAGIDRAIAYTLLARLVGFPCSFLLLPYFIATHLSAAEQGYYFMFNNLLALTMFFDFGLGNIIMLFASHEKAKLHWADKGRMQGDPESLSRLASLFRLGNIWYGTAAVLFSVTVYFIGAHFFASKELSVAVAFKYPWLMAVLITAGALLLAPLKLIFEGCCKVKELRFVSLITPFISYPVIFVVLSVGGGLFAGPAFYGSGLLVFIVWFVLTHRRFIPSLIGARISTARVSWREIWPLQWRSAIGFMSGYLICQLFNPMLFKFRGVEEAGRMGMGLWLGSQIAAVGLTWVNTKSPVMGTCWAGKDYRRLDRIFFDSVLRMVFVTVAGGAVVVWGFFFLDKMGYGIAQRMMDPLPLMFLMLVLPFNNMVLAESMYLRANKREVLVWVSVGYAVLIVAFNWFLGSRYGSLGMMAGYFIAGVISFIVSTVVFVKCRSRWQRL